MSKPNTTGGGGMNPQEAQQAQTIADARKWAAEESAWLSRQELPQSESVEHMDGVLQIVDSQVQTIAADKKAMEIAADLLGVKEHKISESAKVIAELEKDIVRLEDHIRRCEAAGKHVLAPRQYTEQELREHYENCFSAETGEDNTWDGWLECAKFVGALKAEP